MQAAIEQACQSVRPIAPEWLSWARERQRTLTKPAGSLGLLEDVGNRLAALLETPRPQLAKKRLYVVAADHGVTAEGVSAYPPEVTYQMVSNILQGGAAISVLARHGGIELRVVDAGVAADVPSHPQLISRKIVRGSANLAMQPALTRAQAEQSLLVGLELTHQAGSDGIALLGIGEMGIGNTTAASAITTVLTGCAPEAVTGRGTGVDDAGLARKVAVVTRALALHQPDRHQPVDILSAVGGAEIGVMMGLVLGAAVVRLPIVVDGFIATAAAALAVAQCPAVADYLFLGHQSVEPGHRALIDFLGHEPLLHLRLRLGEGTGAALAMHLIDAAAKLLTDMATFESAGISKGPLA